MAWALLAAAVAAVLLLTLAPQEATLDPVQAARGPAGLRGVADSLVNILLFAPVGMAAAFALRRWWLALLLGAAVSAFVELGQLVVPGRYPSFWDLGFNTAGAALGVLLARQARHLLRPSPRLAAWLSLGSAAAALLVMIGGVALLVPAVGHPPLRAEWTPVNRTGHIYGGEVSSVRLGSHPLPAGVAPGAGLPRADLSSGSEMELAAPAARLRAGDTLRVEFRAGPPPPVWVPVFRVSDDHADAVLTIGVRGSDVAFSFRTRAAALHLDQPDLRLPGALTAVSPGDAVSLAAWGEASQYCLLVGGRRACTSWNAADTWALLLYPVPAPVARLLSLLWLVLLFVPAGFWLPRNSVLVPVLLLVAAGSAAGSLAGIPFLRPAQFALPFFGLLVGRVLRRLAAPPAAPVAASPL